jgi:hypothetical protein
MVNQIAQDIQQNNNGGRSSGSGTTFYEPPPTNNRGPSLSDIDIGGVPTANIPPPGGGGASGGGTTTDPPGGGGGGRSEQDCERQYCPMCFDDIDLLGVSVDSQCNECRRVNGANIRACMESGGGGPVVATTAVYRLVCERSRPDSPRPPERCGWYSCLDPDQVKGPNDVVVGTYHSWDQCYEQSSLWSR